MCGVLFKMDGLSTSVIVVFSVPIYAGIDFVLMCGTQAKVRLGVSWLFLFLNVTGIVLAYAHNLLNRNSCVPRQAFTGIYAVINVVYNVVEAGQLIAIIKVHYLKLRTRGGVLQVFSPALKYGVASHVMVSLPRPGEPAAIIMSDGDVVIVPAAVGGAEGVEPGARVARFCVNERLRWLTNLWAVLPFLWIVVAMTQTAFELSQLRGDVKLRCWRILPVQPAYKVLVTINTPLAAAVILSTGILLWAGGSLGGVLLAWCRYWYRSNWVLVLLSVLRGLVFVSPDGPISNWIGYLINFSFLSALALAVADILISLSPSPALKALYSMYIASQAFVAVSSYLQAQARSAPCDTSLVPQSLTWFVVSKVQVVALIVHSLYTLQLFFRVKLVEGITVPIINFSKSRFSAEKELPKHRVTRLESAVLALREVTRL